eukprot:Sdes_comp24056_c0_seq1m22122
MPSDASQELKDMLRIGSNASNDVPDFPFKMKLQQPVISPTEFANPSSFSQMQSDSNSHNDFSDNSRDENGSKPSSGSTSDISQYNVVSERLDKDLCVIQCSSVPTTAAPLLESPCVKANTITVYATENNFYPGKM